MNSIVFICITAMTAMHMPIKRHDMQLQNTITLIKTTSPSDKYTSVHSDGIE